MAVDTKNLDVWVLAGQSNMQGCGWLDGALQPDERVRSFSSAGRWEMAAEPLHRLWESFTPVHQKLMRWGMPETDAAVPDQERAAEEARTRKTGSGLGIAFGKAMADALGAPIGLIPAAHGGTSLEQWSPVLKDQGGHSLYGAMLQRIDRARGRLRGILWYQGESDAADIALARSYADRFDRWISSVRADTGQPDLPVIVVQIGRVLEPANRAGLWPGWDLIREALATLPDRVPHTGVTSAVDLPLVDIIHIDTGGLIRLGRRLARLAAHFAVRASGAPQVPRVRRIERCSTPAGGRNALRVFFSGVSGSWRGVDRIQGFEARDTAGEMAPPIFVVNAWKDGASRAEDASITVLLNRDADERTRLGYGLGLDPVTNLVDEADMPLCSFLPRA